MHQPACMHYYNYIHEDGINSSTDLELDRFDNEHIIIIYMTL